MSPAAHRCTTDDHPDTVICDPDTGYPVLTESLDADHRPAACRGWCNQGRQPCRTPHLCKQGPGVMHRVIEAWTHPDDESLRRITPEEWAREDAKQMRGLLLAIVCLIVCLFVCSSLLAGMKL